MLVRGRCYISPLALAVLLRAQELLVYVVIIVVTISRFSWDSLDLLSPFSARCTAWIFWYFCSEAYFLYKKIRILFVYIIYFY